MTERRDIGSRLENWGRLYQQRRDGDQVSDRRALDQVDAHALDAAMPALPTMQRSLLWWCYVRLETPEEVCGRLGLRARPALHFLAAFHAAQDALQVLAGAPSATQEG